MQAAAAAANLPNRSHQQLRHHQQRKKDSRSMYRTFGLGDAIAALASFLGIKQLQNCGCKDRQERLNRLVPVVWRVRVKEDKDA
jgi:hypothetical protein